MFAVAPSPTTPIMTPMRQTQLKGIVPNFRGVAGMKSMYRSSAPDDLADLIQDEHGASRRPELLDSADHFILYEATLLIDLRSSHEVNEDKQQVLIHQAPGGAFEQVDGLEAMMESQAKRQLLRLTDCALTRSDVLSHVTNNWVRNDHISEYASDAERQGDLVYAAINLHGLPGFYEIILELKSFMATVLKAITMHLERNKNGKIVFHCSIGKDRTGLIAMLCQSMLGMNDRVIVDDYTKSECIRSLAVKKFHENFQGQIDSVSFSNAGPETMMATLSYLRDKYGSVELYLQSTGFDAPWRERFAKIVS